MCMLQCFQTGYHNNENITIAEWMVASSKRQNCLKEDAMTGSEINAVIFIKIWQVAIDAFF